MSRPAELALIVVGSRLRGFKVAPTKKDYLWVSDLELQLMWMSVDDFMVFFLPVLLLG